MSQRCLIVEDEPLARAQLAEYLGMVPGFVVAAEVASVVEAERVLASQTIDVIFLDIELPGVRGIDWLANKPSPAKIVFTTAYSEFALRSYELEATDYLLKPYTLPRLLQACRKVQGQTTAEKDFIFIKHNNKQIRLPLADIRYVEGLRDYIRIHTPHNVYVVHEKLSAFEQGHFLRIHRSYVVSLDHISYVEGNRVFLAEKELPIGPAYREQVNEKIALYKLS